MSITCIAVIWCGNLAICTPALIRPRSSTFGMTPTAGFCGFVLVYPNAGYFDLDVRSDARDSVLEADMLRWAEQRLPATSGAPGTLSTLVNEHDVARRKLLEHHGYTCGAPWLYLERSLTKPLPPVTSPPGFQVRALRPTEADARAVVLAAAFGASVDTERYVQLMATPGYDRTLDIVAVASDGRLGAFALGWFDPVSNVAQFEPVGTAPEFRRLGLGQAVLVAGMEALKRQGAERVVVIVEAAEDLAVRLYSSVGLARQWQLFLYSKPYDN